MITLQLNLRFYFIKLYFWLQNFIVVKEKSASLVSTLQLAELQLYIMDDFDVCSMDTELEEKFYSNNGPENETTYQMISRSYNGK